MFDINQCRTLLTLRTVEAEKYVGKIMFENPSMRGYEARMSFERHKQGETDSILAAEAMDEGVRDGIWPESEQSIVIWGDEHSFKIAIQRVSSTIRSSA